MHEHCLCSLPTPCVPAVGKRAAHVLCNLKHVRRGRGCGFHGKEVQVWWLIYSVGFNIVHAKVMQEG